MATTRKQLVAAVFETPAQAEQAIAALWQAGFAHDRIDMATKSQGLTRGTPRFDIQKDAAKGAVTGAVAGAATGAVAGAVAGSFIPPIGTVLGGVGGAALGAAGGTFLGPFIALEMSEEDAHHYSHAVEEGRTVVIVRAPDRAEEAGVILRSHGGVERSA